MTEILGQNVGASVGRPRTGVYRECLNCHKIYYVPICLSKMYLNCCSLECRKDMSRKSVKCPCGTEFTYFKNRVRVYCSLKCTHKFQSLKRKEATEARRSRTCKQCGKPFIMHHPNGAANRGEQQNGLFCSRKCRWINRMAGPHKEVRRECKVYFKNCVICGSLFTAKTKRYKSCPGKCRVLYKHRRRVEYAPRLENCLECGKPIERNRHKYPRYFCCAKCGRLYAKCGREKGFDLTAVALEHPEIIEAYRSLRNARKAIYNTYQRRITNV